MRITHSRDKSETNYFLDKPLKDVDNSKDLGVTITKDLSWGNHISMPPFGSQQPQKGATKGGGGGGGCSKG